MTCQIVFDIFRGGRWEWSWETDNQTIKGLVMETTNVLVVNDPLRDCISQNQNGIMVDGKRKDVNGWRIKRRSKKKEQPLGFVMTVGIK